MLEAVSDSPVSCPFLFSCYDSECHSQGKIYNADILYYDLRILSLFYLAIKYVYPLLVILRTMLTIQYTIFSYTEWNVVKFHLQACLLLSPDGAAQMCLAYIACVLNVSMCTWPHSCIC